jgi:hypothetical protein
MQNKILGIFVISLVAVGAIWVVEGLYQYVMGGALYHASFTSIALTVVATLAISCLLMYFVILGIEIFKTKD